MGGVFHPPWYFPYNLNTAYKYTRTIKRLVNVLKKNKKFSDSLDIAYANGLHIREDMIPSIMQAKQVVECIRLLPLGYRTVLNLYAIEGFSHKVLEAHC